MRFRCLLGVTLAVAASTPALAATPAPEQDAQPIQEKKICRTEGVTGSRIGKRRICMTRAEWDKVEQANRESMDRMASRQNSRPGDQTNPAMPR